MIGFDQRLAVWLCEAIGRLPEDARADLDRVYLFVTDAEGDPRHRVAVLYVDTAEHQRRRLEAAVGEFFRSSVRWDGNSFSYVEWSVFGDPRDDPEGAASWRAWALEATSEWDASVPGEDLMGDEEEVQELHRIFVEQLVLAVGCWRRWQVWPRAQKVLITLGSDKPGEAIVSLNQQLNGGNLPPDALTWYSGMEEELSQ